MTTRETRDDIRRRCAASAIVTLESDVVRRMCDEADEAEALLDKGARAIVELAETSAAEVDRLTRERDEARAERDARPEITAEQADGFVAHYYLRDYDEEAAHSHFLAAMAALRAHAGKVTR